MTPILPKILVNWKIFWIEKYLRFSESVKISANKTMAKGYQINLYFKKERPSGRAWLNLLAADRSKMTDMARNNILSIKNEFIDQQGNWKLAKILD